jgi:hypothetical protein
MGGIQRHVVTIPDNHHDVSGGFEPLQHVFHFQHLYAFLHTGYLRPAWLEYRGG